METEAQLRKRIDERLEIHDDGSKLFFDATIKGKHVVTMTRYGKQPRDKALAKIEQKKQDKINEFILAFN